MSVARKKAAPADKAKSDAEGVPPDPVDTVEKPAPSAAKAKGEGRPRKPAKAPSKAKKKSAPQPPDEVPVEVKAESQPQPTDEVPVEVKAESQPLPPDEESSKDRGQPGPSSPTGPDPSREDPFLTHSSGRRSRFDPVVNWLKGIPWPKPSWAKDLFRLRPSGLEILVLLLIIVAAIMVTTQLFSGGEQPQASPGALTKRAQRRLPPSLIQAINTLERNTQADRRVISRLQGRLDSLKMQIGNLKDLIKAGESASSKPPDAASPSPTPAPPGAPGAVTPSPTPAPRGAPGAVVPSRPTRPTAGSSQRLTDLEIRLDELSRQVKRLERLLRRSRRSR